MSILALLFLVSAACTTTAGLSSSSTVSACAGQPTHTYSLVPIPVGKADGAGYGRGRELEGQVVADKETTSAIVADLNLQDCNGDGIPGDYDGDHEHGTGGAFFGYGYWANEPICRYGHTVHGGNVAVSDLVFGSNVAFVIGEDDQNGPIVITDPVTGDVIDCETSGSITPGLDSDDCASPIIVGGGSTCGPGGGDGGYWVFLIVHVTIEQAGVSAGNVATTGSITAY